MNFNGLLAIVGACLVALCAADVSHLSRSYLPPQSIGYNGGYNGYNTGYNTGGYSAYPGYSNGGYYTGSGSSYSSPLISSSYKSYVVPQYTAGYAAPSRTYLPADTGYSGYSGYNGLDTKYASNGGYVY
ncbi:prisilkin-39 [Drosophila subobscura]|uniref:prisilkin-39 n=1 Tax=Drosophila subobscura TaxID=7241 RepID=UPI00155A781D|nr:prisilkin-39 [Drosophila subobscura]